MTHLEYITLNSIMNEIAGLKSHSIQRIYLDEFEIGKEDYAYLVIEYPNGGISVRNARCNSFIANLSELSRLLYGGYYDEVEQYKKLKAQKGDNNEQSN